MIRRWFDKGKENESSTSQVASGPRIPRHSGAWTALRKRLQAEPGLRIIDSGVHRARLFRHRLNTGAVFSFKNLPNERPFQKPG